MLLKVADLYTEIPEDGGMLPLCRSYQTNDKVSADIIIRADLYKPERYPGATYDQAVYMDSGFLFYRELLKFGGFYLHSSALEFEGRAYLFSGPSGMGKSTHSRLWQELWGDAVQVFNDDKPALRRLDGRWFAYGIPWCGKDGINQNKKVPLAGICFLRRGEENSIRRFDTFEASARIISQTMRRFKDVENLDLLVSHVDNLVREIPVYELYCRPDVEAAKLSCETMRKGATEAGL